jgi:hypothetical protein
VKRGGFALALLFAISGILRVAGPGSASPTHTEAQAKKKSAASRAPNRADLDTLNSITTTYPDELRHLIDDSYGEFPADDDDKNQSAAHWNVPKPARPHVRFVIAILPDPVHTHLALIFDRGIEALQQAAQRMGYGFDRAILPWDTSAPAASDDFSKRQAAMQEQRERESYPGLLIFREGPQHQSDREAANGIPPSGRLFVLVVAESPTGGLRKEQFKRAVKMIKEIAGDTAESMPLRILGPTFSGSLESLDAALVEVRRKMSAPISRNGNTTRPIYVYSGSVTDSASIKRFSATRLSEPDTTPYFSSFQENDEYTRDQFIQFVCSNDYSPEEIATLSEDETVFGELSPSNVDVPATPSGSPKKSSSGPAAETSGLDAGVFHPDLLRACADYVDKKHPDKHVDLIQLHFPREISYFRSAYQKEISAQQKSDARAVGASTLHLDLQEARGDDDSVPPYATAQNPLSQEAVMLGILTELQKHHVKFTILYASDPADQLFLARYLRTGYPQGRVVITNPDLLFSREEDALLRGVLGISAYALVPGLSDKLHPWGDPHEPHRDHLFVGGTSIGIFNAMLGLLSVTDTRDPGRNHVPFAPYDSYGIALQLDPLQGLQVAPSTKDNSCAAPDGNARNARPLLWLTILGRDGFWPLAGLSDVQALRVADEKLPVIDLGDDLHCFAASTLPTANPPDLSSPNHADHSAQPPPDESDPSAPPRVPPAWSIAYWLSFLMLVVHTFLSFTGSILADSESSTQFARTPWWRDALIVALGALALATAFVLIMFARSPYPFWERAHFFGWTPIMWLPFPLFVIATLWDLGRLREKKYVAVAFAIALFLIVCWQVIAWYPLPAWMEHFTLFEDERISVHWSTRVLHLSSGLSPILPVLLLLAAGYWWMWQSLRGVTLVDLRRPRLPRKADLGSFSYRLSEIEADELRIAAHPLFFTWRVWVAILVPLVVAFSTVLDVNHPVQTIEGEAYDWGYAVLLAIILAAFLTCLFKLAWTWSKCRQILAGLDRLPLREAFSRMERLSWRSLWNPGGSTLRETYKLMSRGMENLTRLKGQIQDWRSPLSETARWTAVNQIEKIAATREDAFKIYIRVVDDENEGKADGDKPTKRSIDFAGFLAGAAYFLRIRPFSRAVKERYRKYEERSDDLLKLLQSIETIQAEMAKMSARLICDVLKPLWNEETSPVVSADEKIAKAPFAPLRVLAEEYAALTYVNFLVTVLLRMRTMVISAIGMYVFIVISMNVYPFEPHPALQTLAIVQLVLLGVVVAYVYAEMHREAILSRLTSKGNGELGWEFWLKLASAGAIPVFSLLAVQFPEINQFLFSWLKPALDAVK